MFQRNFINRTLQIGAVGAAILLCATPGSSEPDAADKPVKTKEKKACKEAFKNAQQLEQGAHLRQARETLQACAKASCSAFMRQECTRRFAQLGSDIPSVVPIVTDAAGAPRTDIQVTMDGELLTSRLDGRALPVDPGVHEFTFNADGGVIATQKIMIVQGQRNQPISVALRSADKRGQKRALAASVTVPSPIDAKTGSLDKPALDNSEPMPERAAPEKSADKSAPSKPSAEASFEDTPTDERPKSGPSTFAYVLGGAGLVGVGTGAALIYWGRKDNSALAQCSPICQQSSVDHIKTMYLAGDIALGAGIAALGISTVLFATSGPSKEKPPAQAAYSFDVLPTRAGAFATVSGKF